MASEKKAEPLLLRKDVLAGGLAAAVARTCVAPFDFLKIRLQIQANKAGSKPVLETFRHVLRTEGVLAFWQGNWAAQLLCVPYGAVSFASYHWSSTALKRLAEHRHKMKTQGSNHDRIDSSAEAYRPSRTAESLIALASGCFSACTATISSYPLDLMRTRLVAQSRHDPVYRSVHHGLASIVRQHGITGLYDGLSVTLIGVVPYMALQFALYEQAKKGFQAYRDRFPIVDADQKPFIGEKMVCGFVAGLGSKFLSMPFDVIKKLHQVDAFRSDPTMTHFNKPTFFGTARKLLKVGGVPALFRGTVPALLKAGPNSALVFGTYEAIMWLLG